MTPRELRQGVGIDLYSPTMRDDAEAPFQAAFALTIDNAEHVVAAFGRDVATAAIAQLAATLVLQWGDSGTVRTAGDDHIEFVVSDRAALGTGALPLACRRFARELCMKLAISPLEMGEARLCLAVSAHWTLSLDSDAAAQAQQSFVSGGFPRATPTPFAGDPVGDDETWRARYRADMRVAANFGDLIADGVPLLAWQPVRHSDHADDILYYQGVLAQPLLMPLDTPRQVMASLERLGLVRALDRYNALATIERLTKDRHTVLGVRISASSAVVDDWWHDVEDQLRCSPQIARRLIVEVAGSCVATAPVILNSFADRARALGCTIGLAGFGIEQPSIRTLIALSPTLVKIDPYFLTQASCRPDDADMLAHIVGVAGAHGAVVVVEGVETAEQADLARRAGAAWQQGRFQGGAALSYQATDRQGEPFTIILPRLEPNPARHQEQAR
jgi:EAL domain-containing protein (putative c-di-GMP-specific phosphodiesterase class I)